MEERENQQTEQGQEKFIKRVLWHQRIRTALMLILVLAVISVIGPAKATLNSVQLLTGSASYAVAELMNTVNALELEKTLDGIDRLVMDSNKMVEDSADDIQASLEKIASLDIDSLNESIQALQAVTTALGRFFGYKGSGT